MLLGGRLTQASRLGNASKIGPFFLKYAVPISQKTCRATRASNFVLTGIKENLNLAELPDGTRVHKMTLASNPTSPRKELGGLTFFDVTGGTYNFKKYLDYVGATPIPGFQLRYIYFIDKSKRKDLTVPEIPFSKIDELGAGMYKGEKITFAERHSKVTPEE